MKKNIHKPNWSYTDKAIDIIYQEFVSKPESSNLICIPTGGGKTLTLIRTLDLIIKNGHIKPDESIVWVNHLTTLKKQAQSVINDQDNIKDFNLNKENLSHYIKILMKSEAEHFVRNDNNKVKIIVIDEAHHSAADSYKIFFQKKLFIIGLTATPHREDEKDLTYDEILYEITMRELIERNVLLRPRFYKQKYNSPIEIDNLESEKDKQKFDTIERNKIIQEYIFSNSSIFNRILIYVGTQKHVLSMYDLIKRKIKYSDGHKYDYVGYVIGGDTNPSKDDFNKKMDNFEYLEYVRDTENKFIIINCGVLTEGYNDTSIDSVVMGVPTKSINYYMQCIGRALRTNKEGSVEAKVIEIDDQLPNITYRVDNLWLFADISDYLEPEIRHLPVNDRDELKDEVEKILAKFNLSFNSRCNNIFDELLDNDDINNFKVLAYNYDPNLGDNHWNYFLVNKNNKKDFLKLYNNFSNKIKEYQQSNSWNAQTFCNKILFKDKRINFFDNNTTAIDDFAESLSEAYKDKHEKNKKVERLKYYTFAYSENQIPDPLTIFLSNCFNKDQVLSQYLNTNDVLDYLIKLPNMLTNDFEAFFINQNQLDYIEELVFKFENIRENVEKDKIFTYIEQIKNNEPNFPFPLRVYEKLKIVVRNRLLINELLYKI